MRLLELSLEEAVGRLKEEGVIEFVDNNNYYAIWVNESVEDKLSVTAMINNRYCVHKSSPMTEKEIVGTLEFRAKTQAPFAVMLDEISEDLEQIGLQNEAKLVQKNTNASDFDVKMLYYLQKALKYMKTMHNPLLLEQELLEMLTRLGFLEKLEALEKIKYFTAHSKIAKLLDFVDEGEDY